MLNSMTLKQHIPVGNADAGGFFNNEVLQAVEYGVRLLFFELWTYILRALDGECPSMVRQCLYRRCSILDNDLFPTK